MKKVIINSLPKSGTNLLAKLLDLAGYTQHGSLGAPLVRQNTIGSYIRNLRLLSCPRTSGYLLGIDSPVMIKKSYIRKVLSTLEEESYVTGHLGYTSDILEDLIDLSFYPVLITRDPRAVLASFVFFVRKEKKHHLHRFFNTLKEEDCFRLALNGFSENQYSLQPLRVRCEALFLWLRDDRVMKVQFESLIGSQGGGDDSSQTMCVQNIFERFSIPEQKMEYVIKNLFGRGRHTFRKGRVDSWREEIPPSLMSNVNDELADILSDWRYSE